MKIRVRTIHCHDCRAELTADDHSHYVYQCHDCVEVEHELILLARREPDHPDVARLAAGPVEFASRAPLVASAPRPRRAAGGSRR